MSTARQSRAVPVLNSVIAATLKRVAVWLETPRPVRANARTALPRELECAEDWLLDDLGLGEADSTVRDVDTVAAARHG